jgi:hypothetical protein
MLQTSIITILAEPVWRARRAAHEARVDAWIEPHRERAGRGEKHPVHDFLFGYYSFRPAWLRRWHPGSGVALAGASARELLSWSDYVETPDGVTLDVATVLERRRPFVTWLLDLLVTMQQRPAFFGCYGWHEWAMVYRQTPEEIRHRAWPLRFSADELARIVDGAALCCTHYDAFRFFTSPARPLNRFTPERESVPQHEQRGCLHANMDLYKWAFKLAPFTPSELIADCFALARDIREVDMRASPYDLNALGFRPIAIETPAGRAEYEGHQRAFAAQGEPLRERLIALGTMILGVAESAGRSDR